LEKKKREENRELENRRCLPISAYNRMGWNSYSSPGRKANLSGSE
jgi:hypothetical protein